MSMALERFGQVRTELQRRSDRRRSITMKQWKYAGVMTLGLCLVATMASAQPVWPFDADLEGWAAAEPGAGDAQVAWDNGELVVTYYDNGGVPI